MQKNKKAAIEDIGRRAGGAIGSAIGGMFGKGLGVASDFFDKAKEIGSEKIDDAKEVIKFYNERQEQKKLEKMQLKNPLLLDEEKQTALQEKKQQLDDFAEKIFKDYLLQNLKYKLDGTPEKIQADVKKFASIAHDKLSKKLLEIKSSSKSIPNISEMLDARLKKIEEEQQPLQEILVNRSNYKIYTSQEITPIFQQIYFDAEEFIFMSYPWFNDFCVNQDVNLINQALRRGVKFYICYGFGDDEKFQQTVNAINLLKSQLVAQNLVKFVRVNSHRKIILCEKYVLQGSQNMMSYRYSEDYHDKREEVTIKIEDIEFVNECKNLILSQKEI